MRVEGHIKKRTFGKSGDFLFEHPQRNKTEQHSECGHRSQRRARVEHVRRIPRERRVRLRNDEGMRAFERKQDAHGAVQQAHGIQQADDSGTHAVAAQAAVTKKAEQNLCSAVKISFNLKNKYFF